MKHLYGFRNNETGQFMATYCTIRCKEKTCCFRSESTALKAFDIHFKRKEDEKSKYSVGILAESEE